MSCMFEFLVSFGLREKKNRENSLYTHLQVPLSLLRLWRDLLGEGKGGIGVDIFSCLAYISLGEYVHLLRDGSMMLCCGIACFVFSWLSFYLSMRDVHGMVACSIVLFLWFSSFLIHVGCTCTVSLCSFEPSHKGCSWYCM